MRLHENGSTLQEIADVINEEMKITTAREVGRVVARGARRRKEVEARETDAGELAVMLSGRMIELKELDSPRPKASPEERKSESAEVTPHRPGADIHGDARAYRSDQDKGGRPSGLDSARGPIAKTDIFTDELMPKKRTFSQTVDTKAP